MSYISPWQPVRPEGNHRTHIKSPSDIYIPWTLRSIIAQIQLYRWSHSLDFQNQTAIGNLHGYLFFNYPDISKRDMGMTVVQATRYNPRRLKGVTLNNPVACSTYVFSEPADLQYGLEWMICTWLHKAKMTEDPEAILDFLNEMATCDEEDIPELYLEPLGPWWSWFSERTFSWGRIWEQLEYDKENELAGPTEGVRPTILSL